MVFARRVIQDEAHHPAAGNVLRAVPAVRQYLRQITPGFFEGICENGQAIEGTVGRDPAGECHDNFGSPRRVEREREAEQLRYAHGEVFGRPRVEPMELVGAIICSHC